MRIRRQHNNGTLALRSRTSAACQCPPHDRRCPVQMKTEPGHVAWTCAKCGAIEKDLDLGDGARTA